MKTILVVDDLAVFREPIALALQASGYDVLDVGDGQQALETFRAHHVDLILLDLAMPVMNGLEFLRRSKAERRVRGTAVLLLTEMAERACVLQAIELGIDGYLLKSSCSIDELKRRVGRLVAGDGDALSAGVTDAVDDEEGALPSGETVASLKPMMTKVEARQRMQAASEPRALSAAIEDIRRLAQEDGVAIDEVAERVRQDPAVALGVLKMANSTVYARGDAVESVEKAVMRIGLTRLSDALLGIGIMESFGEVDTPTFDGFGFWEHAIGTAVIAAELAHQVADVDPEPAFTMGLLHDLGRLIMADALGDTYASVAAVARRIGAPLEDVEARLLRIDHAEALAPLLAQWKFPRELVDPIVLHHKPLDELTRMTRKRSRPVFLLMLANRLAHALMFGDSGDDMLRPVHELCDHLDVDARVIARIEANTRRQTSELMSALLTRVSGPVAPTMLQRCRERVGGGFNAYFAGDAGAADVVRMFVDQLSSDGAPPRVAILHVTSGARRIELVDALLEFEERMETGPLPLIVIGAAARPILALPAVADRDARAADLPVNRTELIDLILEVRPPARAAA